MQHLKIFAVEQSGSTLVVTPHGDGSAFRYRDLHAESNAIRGLILRPPTQNLVIDLGEMDYFGSEFIGSLVTMMRETRNRRGKACFCAVRPEMLQVLQNMGLFKLWPNFPTRAEALESLQPAAGSGPTGDASAS